MDLLGDLGNADQLTSARTENKVLAEKCTELSEKVQTLMLENQRLLAEVEMYRKDALLSSSSSSNPAALANSFAAQTDTEKKGDGIENGADVFMCSGNGVYPSYPAVTLSRLHGISNPLCCVLNGDDTVLATGGADSNLTVSQWGSALRPVDGAAEGVVQKALKIKCDAPVICVAFSREGSGKILPVVAAGCMDGSVQLVAYGAAIGGSMSAHLLSSEKVIKHSKYVKALAWSSIAPLLATASADGTVVLSKVSDYDRDGDGTTVKVETVNSLHLPGAVETVCFSQDGTTLYCYARGTPYLLCFDLNDNCKQSKMNLNGGTTGTTGYEDHVSFAVLDMAVCPTSNGKYLALATDSSRNIIFDLQTGKQIRNLYGHKNDGFSQPKIAWSSNGQYLFGNTQDDNSIYVWDIASSSIVKKLDQGGHTGQIRGIFSSKQSDTIVTTSFDKDTKIWLTPM